ncbi:phosphotransferase family protein [Rhodococcus aetherivorans]
MAEVVQQELTEQLRVYLAERIGDDVQVSEPIRAGAGSSRENWLFDAVRGDGTCLPLVLRRDPSASLVETSRDVEVRVMQALSTSSVPVPQVRWLEESGGPLGAPFIIMDRVPGRADRHLLRDQTLPLEQRVSIAHQLCDVLADIHAVEVDTVVGDEDVPEGFPRLSPREQVDHWAAEIERVGREPLPLLRLVRWWLRDHLPDETDPVLVHGDFRVENVLVERGVLSAVIDWELAHIGSHIEDVAWYLLHRYRHDHLIEGSWTRGAFLARYCERSGRAVPEYELKFWGMLGLYKSAAMALAASAAFINGESNQPFGSADYFMRALSAGLRADQEWP